MLRRRGTAKKSEKPLIERLGMRRLNGRGRPRHTMVLPFSAHLLDWFEGKFETSIRRVSGESFDDDDLTPYQAGQPRATTVVLCVTGYAVNQELDPLQTMQLADSDAPRPTLYVVGQSLRSSDALTYGVLSALSHNEAACRPFGSHPCGGGTDSIPDLIWGVLLHQGELIVRAEIEVSLGSGVDLEEDMRRVHEEA